MLAHARVHMEDITGVLLDPERGEDTPRSKVEEASNNPAVPDYSPVQVPEHRYTAAASTMVRVLVQKVPRFAFA